MANPIDSKADAAAARGDARLAAAAGRTAATPQGCTHLKLKQLGRAVGRHFDAHVAPSGLRITQYSLLSHVVRLQPLRLGELAAVMRLEPSTLTRNLQPLLARGLVEVHTGDDLRSRVVQASAAGEALRQDAQKAWKRAQLALNQTLGDARVLALHGLIDDCLGLLADAADAADSEGEHGA